MKKINKLRVKLTPAKVVILKLLTPSIALASSHRTDLIDTPEKVENLLGAVAGWIYAIFIGVAVIIFLYSAFLYLTAAGSPEKISSAKKTLVYGVVALVIAVLAGGIPTLIEGFLGGNTGSGGPPACSPSLPPGTICIN